MPLDRARMEEIAGRHSTVAGRIRALNQAGVARADIARFLGKRYQHVRNVLEGDAQSGSGGYTLGRADLSGLQEGPRPFDRDEYDEHVQARGGGIFRIVVRPDGSIFMPPEVLESFGLGPGGVLIAELKGDTFEIVSGATALRQIQEAVAPYRPKDGSSVVEAFLSERRARWGQSED